MTPLTCSNCGNPVPLTPDLEKALEDVPATPRSIVILCPDCADASADTPPSSPPQRVYRVQLLISELVGTTPSAIDEEGQPVGEEEEVWDDVGGFQIKAPSTSVRKFAYDNADSFTARLETLLSLADADPGHPPPPSTETQELPNG